MLHSHEPQVVEYRYVVGGTRGGKTYTRTGSVSLQPGQTRQLSAVLTPGSTKWSRISVTLQNRSERISWLSSQRTDQTTTGVR